MLILLSCEGEDEKPLGASIHLAALQCGKSIDQMQWLTGLISRSEDDATLIGDIYAGKLDGQVVFIHQPLIMSCLACIVYDCDGNLLDRALFDLEKLQQLVGDTHRIYRWG